MSKIDFSGMGVALITPFKSDGQIDFDALEGLLDFHLSNNTDYLVALGTTAETPTLTNDEQLQIVRFIVDKIDGRLPIVMGLGGNCTAMLVEKIKKNNFEGVDAILSVTPYYNKPTQEGLFRHYCTLSEASPFPVILYNVPGRTGVNMSAETTLRIANTCGNVIAIKEASGNLEQIKDIIAGAPAGFSVISGDDTTAVSAVEMGGIGVISVFGNAFPKEMSRLIKNALSGNSEDIPQEMKSEFTRMFQFLFVEGNPAGIKFLLSLKGKIENVLRLPLTSVSTKTQSIMRDELNKNRYLVL